DPLRPAQPRDALQALLHGRNGSRNELPPARLSIRVAPPRQRPALGAGTKGEGHGGCPVVVDVSRLLPAPWVQPRVERLPVGGGEIAAHIVARDRHRRVAAVPEHPPLRTG